MILFKRKIEEADQFVTKEAGTASDPDIALSGTRDAGFYKKSDAEITSVLSNTDSMGFLNGRIRFYSGDTTDPATNNTIFVSGNSLQFRDGAGAIRRLDA